MTNSCHFLSKDGLSKQLQDHKTLTYLFPDRRMVVDAVPFQLVQSNVPLMFGKDTVFVSDANIDKETNSATGLLTAGTYSTTQSKGHSFRLDIFGLNIESLEAHLLMHFHRLLEKKMTVQILLITLYPGVDVNHVKKLLASYGFEYDPVVTSWYPEVKLYEMEL